MTAKASLTGALGAPSRICGACGKRVARGHNYGHRVVALHKSCMIRLRSGWNTGNPDLVRSVVERMLQEPDIRWDLAVFPTVWNPISEDADPREIVTMEIRLTLHRRPR